MIELTADQLRRTCSPIEVTSPAPRAVGQARAVEAIETALRIRRPGFHIFAAGDNNLDARSIVRELVTDEAGRRGAASDWCYVQDLDLRRPRMLRMPPGTAVAFRAELVRVGLAIGAEVTQATANGRVPEMTPLVRRHLEPVRAAYRDNAPVQAYLDHVEVDFVAARRFDINVIVDRTGELAAPVVEERHPTRANLLGKVVHLPQQGGLVTGVMLIQPGALHRANGGFLLLDAIDVLREPMAWNALLRALRAGEIRIEPPEPTGSTPTIATLDPEPIPLDLTVVMFGDHALLSTLQMAEPKLADVFAIVADFAPTMERTRDSEVALAGTVVAIARERGSRPLDPQALARTVEHSSRLANDAQKLSLDRRAIADLIVEANDHAACADRAHVGIDDIDGALAQLRRRHARLEEEYLDAVRRDTIMISTTGSTIGQINALAVVDDGEWKLGIARRVSVRMRLGGGEVIDIERETELGGPLHSKGVLILAGFLGARFAEHQPMAVAATIVFEQSYGGIDGDSASLAELCALVSAIGAVPLRQDLAVTGSLDQHGDAQPVGGVNEKIEAFFAVCRQRELTGTQGVIIPRRNMAHLMLRRDVIEAVAAGQFHIYAVEHADEALALLTGLAVGVRDEDGYFPDGSVNAMVEHRLSTFIEDTHRFARDANQPHRRGRWTIHTGGS